VIISGVVKNHDRTQSSFNTIMCLIRGAHLRGGLPSFGNLRRMTGVPFSFQKLETDMRTRFIAGWKFRGEVSDISRVWYVYFPQVFWRWISTKAQMDLSVRLRTTWAPPPRYREDTNNTKSSKLTFILPLPLGGGGIWKLIQILDQKSWALIRFSRRIEGRNLARNIKYQRTTRSA
jgi:hypothetical protein